MLCTDTKLWTVKLSPNEDCCDDGIVPSANLVTKEGSMTAKFIIPLVFNT